jgi:hypothetical protein
MPVFTAIQPSFAAGELTPLAWGRVDLAKFHVGCRTLENFLVHPQGGASNRPGTRYIGEVDDSTKRHRLIPFEFRTLPTGQAYALVFGDMTMQVVMFNGTSWGFVLDGSNNIYTLTTPYAYTDLPTLKFVQSADTMTLVHPSYAPQKLTRTAHDAWTIGPITFAPTTAAPTGLASTTPGSSGSTLVVTAINGTTGEESLASASATGTGSTDVWNWTAVSGAKLYNVYKKTGSVFGFIAQVSTNTFTEDNLSPNISNQPATGSTDPFPSTGNYPGATGYYQQRQWFGDTSNNPGGLWASQSGAFNNMNTSTPTQDSDAITRTLVSGEVDEVRHLVPVGTSMLILTSGAIWRCWPGPSSVALTPGSCYTLPQDAIGTSHVPPFWTDNSLVMFQEKGVTLQALRYDAIQDLFTPQDMGVLAQHLFFDVNGTYQIQERAWAKAPFRICWCVRSDGTLLGFTYMREQDVYAWHRHTTQGTVESICSITEADGFGGYEDAVYLIINRTVNGATKRYVERMVSRTFPTVSDMWFLDCALQYSGTATDTISGLSHLEGMSVYALCDGSVVGPLTVTSGSVTLDGSYSKVTVGLAYTSTLETLNLEVPGGGTQQGKMKKIPKITVRVKDTRGISMGLASTNLDGSDDLEVLEAKEYSDRSLGTALATYTGDLLLEVPTEWDTDGRIVVEQTYPLPVTILDLIPDVNLGA